MGIRIVFLVGPSIHSTWLHTEVRNHGKGEVEAPVARPLWGSGHCPDRSLVGVIAGGSRASRHAPHEVTL